MRGIQVVYACLFLFFPLAAIAQDYGLRFRSHETVVDGRTSLDLSHKEICFDNEAELSLMLRFRDDAKGYYGYTWRMLTARGLNIDLIFKPSFPGFRFNLIIGKAASGLSFELDSLHDWNEIRLKLDAANDEIRVITADTVLRKANVGLAPDECLQIAFGRSYIEGIRAADLPPMSVRDIRLVIDGKMRHYWPLNESDGTVAHDVLSGFHGVVNNPEWIQREYRSWRLLDKLNFRGPVSLAFNEREESVLILSNDSLLWVPVSTGERRMIPLEGDTNLVSQGDQAIYIPWENKLININLNRKRISSYDFENSTWKKMYPDSHSLTRFWHHNKVINSADSTLVTLGGYGNLSYNNLVQRYDLVSGTWDTLTLTGDFISPRYLFGLSESQDNISYALGGYGSATGDQMLYPEHYQDIYRINWKALHSEKLFELNFGNEPVVFASSLVVEGDSAFYGLLFPRFRSNSFLQLIKGSLEKPVFETAGDSIPFYFHDIYSYADLFLAERSKMLTAVTSFYDNASNSTSVEIHTISYPPTASAGAKTFASSSDSWVWIASIGGICLVVVVIAVRRANRKKQTRPGDTSTVNAVAEAGEAGIRIRFFGGFWVSGASAQDQTAKFTPLLKELFLLIALNTLRAGKGVSSAKLDELFWPDKSEKSARNNRSVNIAKLKLILSEIGPIEISKHANNWSLVYDHASVRIDYADYLTLIRRENRLSISQIKELIRIVGSSSLLSEVQYEWLDHFKSATESEIVEAVSEYIKTIDRESGFEHQVEIANFVTIFDPVNDDAMQLQCRALSRLGNHTLAKNAYEKFRKEYFVLYGEEYHLTFQQVLEGEIPASRRS